MIDHVLSCPKGGLVLEQHDDAEKDWGALGSWVLVPSEITYEPEINSSAVQGGRTGAIARQNGGTADDGVDTEVEAQGGSVPMVNGDAILVE